MVENILQQEYILSILLKFSSLSKNLVKKLTQKGSAASNNQWRLIKFCLLWFLY